MHVFSKSTCTVQINWYFIWFCQKNVLFSISSCEKFTCCSLCSGVFISFLSFFFFFCLRLLAKFAQLFFLLSLPLYQKWKHARTWVFSKYHGIVCASLLYFPSTLRHLHVSPPTPPSPCVQTSVHVCASASVEYVLFIKYISFSTDNYSCQLEVQTLINRKQHRHTPSISFLFVAVCFIRFSAVIIIVFVKYISQYVAAVFSKPVYFLSNFLSF